MFRLKVRALLLKTQRFDDCDIKEVCSSIYLHCLNVWTCVKRENDCIILTRRKSLPFKFLFPFRFFLLILLLSFSFASSVFHFFLLLPSSRFSFDERLPSPLIIFLLVFSVYLNLVSPKIYFRNISIHAFCHKQPF